MSWQTGGVKSVFALYGLKAHWTERVLAPKKCLQWLESDTTTPQLSSHDTSVERQCMTTTERSAPSVTRAVMLKIRLNILQQQAKKNRQASQQERVPQSRASNLRILSEKYLQNQQDPYYHVFIDLKKAFYRVCGKWWRSTTSAPPLFESWKTSRRRPLVQSSSTAGLKTRSKNNWSPDRDV